MRHRFDFRVPTATAVISAIAVVASFDGRLSPWLEYHRTSMVAGQWWRLLTGHLVHWDASHGFWDVLMFAVLGATCEGRGRGRFLACVATAAVAISAMLWWCVPEMVTYRGLSGIDSALYTLAVALVLRDAIDEHAWKLAALCGAALAGFAGKLGYEIVTGATLFVDSTGSEFVPLPLVHVVGGLVGLAFAWGDHRGSQRAQLPRRYFHDGRSAAIGWPPSVIGTGREPA